MKARDAPDAIGPSRFVQLVTALKFTLSLPEYSAVFTAMIDFTPPVAGTLQSGAKLTQQTQAQLAGLRGHIERHVQRAWRGPDREYLVLLVIHTGEASLVAPIFMYPPTGAVSVCVPQRLRSLGFNPFELFLDPIAGLVLAAFAKVHPQPNPSSRFLLLNVPSAAHVDSNAWSLLYVAYRLRWPFQNHAGAEAFLRACFPDLFRSRPDKNIRVVYDAIAAEFLRQTASVVEACADRRPGAEPVLTRDGVRSCEAATPTIRGVGIASFVPRAADALGIVDVLKSVRLSRHTFVLNTQSALATEAQQKEWFSLRQVLTKYQTVGGQGAYHEPSEASQRGPVFEAWGPGGPFDQRWTPATVAPPVFGANAQPAAGQTQAPAAKKTLAELLDTVELAA